MADICDVDCSSNNAITKKRPILLVLFGLFALIFLLRLHTYREPLERDLTTYAVIAHEMLGGRALYSDMWDHKPPAIHVTYAAAELVAGYGRNSIFVMTVTAAFATLLACYFAGSAVGGPAAGLIAAVFWALTSGDLAMEGNQPNTEVFLNAFLTTSFAVMVRIGKRNLGLRGAVLVGLLFAVASLYKQVVIIQAALLVFVYFAWRASDSWKKALAEVAIIASVGIASWALVFGYFFAHGRSQAFVDAIVSYNRYYAGNIWENLSHALSKPPRSPEALVITLPLAILSVAGVILGLIFGPRRHWILLLALVVATHIAILLPGQYSAHYYQLWLPPLAIGAAWTVSLLRQILRPGQSWLSYAVAGVACGTLVFLEAPNYETSPEDWSVKKYGNIFAESERLARQIDVLLSPNETFYEWGAESGLYYTSGRQPPSGIMFADPMLTGPVAAKLSRRLIDDLDHAKPELLVVEWQMLKKTPRDHPALKWFDEHYRSYSTANKFILLARKGGRLDQRKTIAGPTPPKSGALESF
jgi:hypothetical protein